MTLLVNSFNPSAAEGVMCRDTLSIGWDGQVFDCDFNQQLQLPLGVPLADLEADAAHHHHHHGKTVFDFASADDALNEKIVLDFHCFGCTAGEGSSCQGATAE